MYGRTKGTEQVKASIKSMKPIPADANPFLHDDYSMGTNLVRGWVVMHEGFDSKENPQSLDWIYLVNTRTGQRIKVVLKHKYRRTFEEWMSDMRGNFYHHQWKLQRFWRDLREDLPYKLEQWKRKRLERKVERRFGKAAPWIKKDIHE